MGIPEQQLLTWSNRGSITTSETTHQSIRNCIDTYKFPENVKCDIYLQGSYRNHTNIYGNSDVDVVIELQSTLKPTISQLSEEDVVKYHKKYSDATYKLKDFKANVLQALNNYYDPTKVVEGNKAIKIEGCSGRLNADVIVAMEHRYFWHINEIFEEDQFTKGIAFTKMDGSWVYSYPKQHYENGCKKMGQTNSMFKPLVRIFKNIKGKLENNFGAQDSYLSSHLIESLVYNLPNGCFSTSLSTMLVSSLNWFNDQDFSDFEAQHGLYKLFGESMINGQLLQLRVLFQK